MKSVLRPALAPSAGGGRGCAAAVAAAVRADDSTARGDGVVGDQGIHPLKNRTIKAEAKAHAVNGDDDGGGGGNAVDIQHSPTFQVWSRESHVFCTECEDTRATVLCLECDEEYCSLCWAALHRRGRRAKHTTKPIVSSAEALAPPPEALEESGWLAGVWPSHRPPSAEDGDTAVAGFPSAEGGVIPVKGGDVGKPPPPSLAPPNLLGLEYDTHEDGVERRSDEGIKSENGNGNACDEEEDLPPQNGRKRSGDVVQNGSSSHGSSLSSSQLIGSHDGSRNGSRNGSHSGGLRIEGEPPPPRSPTAMAETNISDSVGGSNGIANVDVGKRGTPSTATASAGAPAVKQEEPVTAAADAATVDASSAVGRSAATHVRSVSAKRGHRPPGFEGPLCPSGEFFSKPQQDGGTGNGHFSSGGMDDRELPLSGVKRARPDSGSRLPCAESSVTQSASMDGTAAAAAAAAAVSGEGDGVASREGSGAKRRGVGDGVRAVSGGTQGGSGTVLGSLAVSAESVEHANRNGGSHCAPITAAAVGGTHGGQGSHKATNGHEANGHQSRCSGRSRNTESDPGNVPRMRDSSASRSVADPFDKSTANGGQDGGGAPPPPQRPDTGRGLINGGGNSAGGEGVSSLPTSATTLPSSTDHSAAENVCKLSAAATAAAAGDKGVAGSVEGGEDGVGSARVPTEVEARQLKELERRAYNVPLRLDSRERVILGVLEGALHHVPYTDNVDVINRNRLSSVVKNLKIFLTSLWGMYKAAGVTPPPRPAPPAPPKNSGTCLNNSNHHQQFGPIPYRAVANHPGAAVQNGFSNGATMGGNKEGRGQKGGKVGAAAYRHDQFAFKRTAQEYNRDWVAVARMVCEVGRRHKILNPDKMRGSHGKLMCVLMDAEHPLVKEHTGFSADRHIRTAAGLAGATELGGLLQDPDILLASRPVLPWTAKDRLAKMDGNRDRLESEAKAKAEARKRLIRRHGGDGMASEVTLLVDSLADAIVYREISTRPIRRMIALLRSNWRPDRVHETKNAALGIISGQYGARLTHDHRTQFYYVLQSLQLWLEILDNMLDLWRAGEKDMLEEHNQYNLRNTGQGLHRVQGAPTVGRLMREYQRRVAIKSGRPWVGSAVVHLGDNCVPNALTFLDKYSQIPWILNPILQVVDYLSEIDDGKCPEVKAYIENRWNDPTYLKRYILRNFFRSAFDGSGGNNNYEAGSCVDGRLTSTWNWCSKIEKRSYYPIFMMSGFNGFDGDFSR